MENLLVNDNRYKVLFSYNESLLNIFIKDKKLERKIIFETLHLSFKDILIKDISNFKDLINQIKQRQVFIEIKEPSISTVDKNGNDSNLIFLNLNIINNSNEKTVIISKKIYSLNISKSN